MTGGYETGYQNCGCLWGNSPGSLLGKYVEEIGNPMGKWVLDVGAGEGKNTAWFMERGAKVVPIEISKKAIENGKRTFPILSEIEWVNSDIRSILSFNKCFDVVILYGLYHCMNSREEVDNLFLKLSEYTLVGGTHIVCAFNARKQELELAHPGFSPTLISHNDYKMIYKDWDMLYISDSDLKEIHPHNGIEHSHSMTRFIAQKKRGEK